MTLGLHASAVAILAAAAVSCSSAAAPSTTAQGGDGAGALDASATWAGPASATATTDAGLKLELRTDPQPPPRGSFTVLLTVTDANGAPVDGLSVDAVPWMPAMGHGASVRTSVAPQGGGRYGLTHVTMFMPGDWELRITLSGSNGPSTDHAAPILTIP